MELDAGNTLEIPVEGKNLALLAQRESGEEAITDFQCNAAGRSIGYQLSGLAPRVSVDLVVIKV